MVLRFVPFLYNRERKHQLYETARRFNPKTKADILPMCFITSNNHSTVIPSSFIMCTLYIHSKRDLWTDKWRLQQPSHTELAVPLPKKQILVSKCLRTNFLWTCVTFSCSESKFFFKGCHTELLSDGCSK
jgi:hypothetical protein